MNEEINKYIYDYEDISFTLFIPSYWEKIYKGQPRKKLYHDYCVMLDLVKKVDKSRWILDVGANNGLFCIPAVMMGYRVYAFEPIKKNFDCLEESRKLNNIKGSELTIFDCALSNEDGDYEIFVPECLDNASFSKDAAIANMKDKNFTVEKVHTYKYDSLLFLRKFEKEINIGLVKIDVQGAEYEVIEGMKEFLTNAHDIYTICEYEDHLLKMGHTFEELDELFREYGFVEQPKILPNDKLWYKQ